MFRYRLHSPDGDDLGEATYAMQIKPGEEIHANGGERLRVVDVVPFDEEDELRLVGLLVEPGCSTAPRPTETAEAGAPPRGGTDMPELWASSVGHATVRSVRAR